MAHNVRKSCVKCSKDFRANVFARHSAACNGPKIKKIRGIDFDPNSGYKNGTRVGWNKGLTKETSSSVKSASDTMSQGYADGRIKLSGFAADATYFGSSAHKEASSKGGGYREKSGRSHKSYVTDSFDRTVCLQSSFELELSKILDSRNLRWKREGCFIYDSKRYFPDFYLVDFDVYLDVKNPYLITVDAEKIQKVKSQNPSLQLYVFILQDAEKTLDSIIQIHASLADVVIAGA